jgi:hypothetical protein
VEVAEKRRIVNSIGLKILTRRVFLKSEKPNHKVSARVVHHPRDEVHRDRRNGTWEWMLKSSLNETLLDNEVQAIQFMRIPIKAPRHHVNRKRVRCHGREPSERPIVVKTVQVIH